MLSAQNLTKTFGDRTIFANVNFLVRRGETVGLVGANGTGKTTLLKLLSGQLAADGGSIETRGECHLAHLPEEDGAQPLETWLGPAATTPARRLGLGEALGRPLNQLSGGERTRAALAKALSQPAHLLLLDEPTNHLDQEGIAWLSDWLQATKQTVLVVSHDRWFLDQVATRILELHNQTLSEYNGNYSAYAKAKAAEQAKAEADYADFQKERRRLKAALQRQQQWHEQSEHTKKPHDYNIGWRNDLQRSQRTVANQRKQTERRIAALEAQAKPPEQPLTIRIRVEGEVRKGGPVLLAEGLGHRFGHDWLIRPSSWSLPRGERIALTGPNGAGKTTLIRLITGELQPTTGKITAAQPTALLAQHPTFSNPAHTVYQEATADLTSRAERQEARTLLGCLLFRGEAQNRPVSVLSQGERTRLALAKLLLQRPALLILDEPTNHLDLASREAVEAALLNYEGSLLFVSHDRYFTEKVATRTLTIDRGHLKVDQPSQPTLATDRLLLETRLAEVSARLATLEKEDPAYQEAEALFFELRKQLG